MSKFWKYFLLIQGAIAIALIVGLIVVGIALFRQNDAIRDRNLILIDQNDALKEQNRLLRTGCDVK